MQCYPFFGHFFAYAEIFCHMILKSFLTQYWKYFPYLLRIDFFSTTILIFVIPELTTLILLYYNVLFFLQIIPNITPLTQKYPLIYTKSKTPYDELYEHIVCICKVYTYTKLYNDSWYTSSCPIQKNTSVICSLWFTEVNYGVNVYSNKFSIRPFLSNHVSSKADRLAA
jgi:hypothetical protein